MKKFFKVFILVIFAFVISGCSSYSNYLKSVNTNLSVASFYSQHYLSKLSVLHQNLPNAIGVFEENNQDDPILKATRSMYFLAGYAIVLTSVMEEEVIVSAMDFMINGSANSEIKERYYEYINTYPIEIDGSFSSNSVQMKHVVKVKSSSYGITVYFWVTNLNTNILTLEETAEDVIKATFEFNSTKGYKYDRQTKQYSNISMTSNGENAKLNFCYLPEKGYLNFSYADSTATNSISKTICLYQNNVVGVSTQCSVEAEEGSVKMNLIVEHLVKAKYERIKIGALSSDNSNINNLLAVEESSLANKNSSDGIGYVFTSDNTKDTPSETVVPYGVINAK